MLLPTLFVSVARKSEANNLTKVVTHSVKCTGIHVFFRCFRILAVTATACFVRPPRPFRPMAIRVKRHSVQWQNGKSVARCRIKVRWLQFGKDWIASIRLPIPLSSRSTKRSHLWPCEHPQPVWNPPRMQIKCTSFICLKISVNISWRSSWCSKHNDELNLCFVASHHGWSWGRGFKS